MQRIFRVILSALAFLAVGSQSGAAAESSWIVGVAKVDITPDYPVRLSGYGNRREECAEVKQRIWAKALAFGSDTDGPAVLATVDNCGVPAAMRDELLHRLGPRTKLRPERLAICSSHTHCAPMLTGVLPNLFSADMPPEHQAGIERYTKELTDKLEQVVLSALADRRPALLAWGAGHAGFAQNRRAAWAFRPEDHSLPVLRVSDPGGAVRAVLTSYACHCTTLAFNVIHGDWAGHAQAALEEVFPGAVALTAIGCGADQNPEPRRTYELCEQYGRALADEAKRLVTARLTPVRGPLECRTKQVQLPFDRLPARAEWERRAQDKAANIAYHARRNLARLDRGERLPAHLPYLVQVWNFGTDLAMVFLPGEVVVDYSLRLKREFDSQRLWVNAYANDVPCYIPSERVLQEGGYEGETAMLYYDRPTRFAPGVEERIIGAVRDLMPRHFRRPR